MKLGSPVSMAGLPSNSACVKVGPPLSCKRPSIESVLIWSPGTNQDTATVVVANAIAMRGH